MLVQKPEVLELRDRNDNKHFIAYRKAVSRICSLKMQLLHGTVALSAWVHGSCVGGGGIESLNWPGYYL